MSIHDDDCFGGDPDDYDMTASDRFALALNQAGRDKAAMTSATLADRLMALVAKIRAESEEWGGLTIAEKWADELTAIAMSEHSYDASDRIREWLTRLDWLGAQPPSVRTTLREECRARGGHVKSGEAFLTNPPVHVCAHCGDEFRDEDTTGKGHQP